MTKLTHDKCGGVLSRKTLVCRKCKRRPGGGVVTRTYTPEASEVNGGVVNRYAKKEEQRTWFERSASPMGRMYGPESGAR